MNCQILLNDMEKNNNSIVLYSILVSRPAQRVLMNLKGEADL